MANLRSITLGRGVPTAGLEVEEEANAAIDTLLRYGFLGVVGGPFSKPTFVFEARGGVDRLRFPLNNDDGSLVVHPAFRPALAIDGVS